MFTWKKKKDVTHSKVFDKELFEDFVSVVQKTANIGNNIIPNAIPVSYAYIGKHYSHILFKYKVDKYGNIAHVSFELPRCKANERLDCLIINVSRSAKEAIKFLDKLTDDAYA